MIAVALLDQTWFWLGFMAGVFVGAIVMFAAAACIDRWDR